MKERPILFNGEMVRAILEGRKTQTRRVVNLDRLKVIPRYNVRGDWLHFGTMVLGDKATPGSLNRAGAVCGKATNGEMLGLKPEEFDFHCPYADGSTVLQDNDRGVWRINPDPGQRLWVRETWAESGYKRIEYKAFPADGSDFRCVTRWKPSIHMPRWASRITLEVTGVRVERVQEISERDAEAEGIDESGTSCTVCNEPYACAVDGFACLWNSINAKRGYSWESNPWVWVVEFKQIQPNVKGEP